MSTALNLWELLRLFSGDDTDALWWTSDDEGNLRFFVTCNDFFAWGCSDCEQINLATSADLTGLRAAKGEAEYDWPLLWVARKRGQRPQGACYKNLEPANWPLFDACGPLRSTGLGNPRPQPGEQPDVQSPMSRRRALDTEVAGNAGESTVGGAS